MPGGFVSSGSLVIDKLLGGGYPRGRLTTVAAEDEAGKTLMGLSACRGTEAAVFIDADQKLVPDRQVLVLGGDADVVFIDFNDFAAVADVVTESIGIVDLIVIDTIQSCVTSADLGIDAAHASRALDNAWEAVLRRIGPELTRSDTAILALARMWPIVWPFWRRSSVFFQVRKGPPINQGIERVGHWVNLEYRDVHARTGLLFATGFDKTREQRLEVRTQTGTQRPFTNLLRR